MADLRAAILGDGPERAKVEQLVRDLGSRAMLVDGAGFVATETSRTRWRGRLCMLLPSRREGYGLIVLEAAATVGTPSIVVAES